MTDKARAVYKRILEGETMASIARDIGVSASRVRQLREEAKAKNEYELRMAWATGMRERTRKRLYRIAEFYGKFDDELPAIIIRDKDTDPLIKALLRDHEIAEIDRWAKENSDLCK